MTQHDPIPEPPAIDATADVRDTIIGRWPFKRDISENFPISEATHAEGRALVQAILDKKAATDAQS